MYDNDAPGNATVTVSGNIVVGFGALVLFDRPVNGNLVVANNRYSLEDGLGTPINDIYRVSGSGRDVTLNDFESNDNTPINYTAPKMTDVYGTNLEANLLNGIMPDDPINIVERFRNDALS